MAAAGNGFVDVIALLVELGADVHYANEVSVIRGLSLRNTV